MELHVYTAKDDPCKVGFRYGPIALAGALGTENLPETDILDDHMKLHHHPLHRGPYSRRCKGRRQAMDQTGGRLPVDI